MKGYKESQGFSTHTPPGSAHIPEAVQHRPDHIIRQGFGKPASHPADAEREVQRSVRGTSLSPRARVTRVNVLNKSLSSRDQERRGRLQASLTLRGAPVVKYAEG